MLKEIALAAAVLSPTGIPAETPEIYFTPSPQEHADTETAEQGLILVEGYVDSREAQYFDDTYYYHDYVVTEVEWNKNPLAKCGYWTIWGIDDYGTVECLGDDIAEEDLEDWMVVGTKVRHRWMPTEEWYHSIDFEIIG